MAKLQDKVTINGMQLCNRIALPPLTTNYGMPQGLVTDEIIQFYTVGKILAGKSSEIITCEECMTCFATIGCGAPMACKVNHNLPGAARSA